MKLLVFLLSLSVAFASVYMINASFDPTLPGVEATQIVHWSNPLKESTSVALFVLYPNLHRSPNEKVSPLMREASRGWIKVERVQVDGKDASFTILETFTETFQEFSKDKTLLEIYLGRNVSPNQEVEIRIRFKTKFPEEGEDEGCYGGACIWRFGWYPLEVYSKNGQYQKGMVYTPHTCYLKVKAPKGWKSVYHEGSGMGCPIAFLKGYEEFSLDGGYYRVVVHHRKGLRWKAEQIAAITLHALNVYSKRFGKLDYKDVHIIESPYSGSFGMTAAGMIILGDNAFTTSDLVVPGFTTPVLEFLIYHEVAHLWFGIGATVDFTKDNFLSESLAQYSAITQIEAERGATSNLFEDSPDILTNSLKSLSIFESIRENYLYYYRWADRWGIDRPVEGKKEYLNQNLPIDYSKGYFAFRTLSLLFDDFDSFLKEYHERFKNSVVTYEDLKKMVLEKKPDAEKALEELFENEKGIDARVISEGKTVKVEIPEGVPYQIEVVKGGKSEIYTLREPTSIENAEEVHVDPNWFLPDPDRFNNHHPVLIQYPFGDYESPLEAYKLDFAYSTLQLSASSLYAGLGIGVSKFDEWSFSLSAGNSYTFDSSSATIESYGANLSFSFKPKPYILLLGSAYLDSSSTAIVSGLVGFTIPEVLDIGYSPKYIYPRSSVYIGGDYESGEYSGWMEYDFVDLIKTSLAFGIYTSLNSKMEKDLLSQLSYFPTDFMDVSLLGVHSESGILPGDLTDLLRGSVGLHLNVDFPWRENILNVLSFRGFHFSIKGGAMYEDFEKIQPFAELSAVLKMYTILDRLFLLGVNVVLTEEGVYYYLGASLEDTVLSVVKTAISAEPSPLLRSRIHPSLP